MSDREDELEHQVRVLSERLEKAEGNLDDVLDLEVAMTNAYCATQDALDRAEQAEANARTWELNWKHELAKIKELADKLEWSEKERHRHASQRGANYARAIDAEAALAEALEVIRQISPALNAAFAAGCEEREGGSERRQARAIEEYESVRAAARTFMERHNEADR